MNGFEDFKYAVWAVEGLSITGAEVPVPFAEAVQLGKRGGARPGAGRPKKGEQREVGNQVDNINLNKGGTSAAYLLARIHQTILR